MSWRSRIARKPILLAVALIGSLLACLALPWLSGTATREAALEQLAGRSLDELALLAGLRDDEGQALRDEPFVVEVVQDGGSLWIAPAIEDAVEDSEWFATGNSRHLLRVEVVEDPRALALQLHLWRAGWELRSPEPLRVRTSPWMIVIAGLVGAATALAIGRISLGLAAAGALAQLMLGTIVPPHDLFAPQTTWTAWQTGPLFGRLLPWISSMSTLELAIAVALIGLCLVLVWFDHRRSHASAEDLDLAGAVVLALLGTLGTIGLVEAVFRSGFAASLGTGAGVLALVGLVLAWVPALARTREQWHAQRRLVPRHRDLDQLELGLHAAGGVARHSQYFSTASASLLPSDANPGAPTDQDPCVEVLAKESVDDARA